MELIERLQEALGDRYTVERELGRGGMATVFLARDLKHDRPVAVKVLHDDLASSLTAERFQREIQIAGRLTHPNILPLYDSGRLNGSLYYVMPYVEGESLRSRLDREHQLPIAEAVRITCEVAAALDHAHRQGVLHRDIKPENILLEDGHAVIADFGIARAMTDSKENITHTGISLGTPGYMSPEQSSATREIDGRSDQYAVGCVLYELLVGAPPFTGPNPQAVMARHALDPVPSMRTVRATIPAEVEAAVVRALAKSPADRFASMHEFSDALCGAASPTTTTVTFAVPNVLRRKSPLVGSIVAIALLAAASLWFLGDSPDRQVIAGTLDLDPRRVAVLYFDDQSRDGTLSYLADGLTESLIEQLESVRGLDVISRNGVAPYRGAEGGLDSIAGALQAGTLVRGAVEPAGDRVRVTVRLVDRSGADFRRASFERPLGDPLATSDSLAEQVAYFLRERLGEEVRLRETRAAASHPEAWSLVQRAEALRKSADDRYDADSAAAADALLADADSLLRQAEALDPRWTAPILLRGQLALGAAERHRSRTARLGSIEDGLRHAERALALEPASAEALELRGSLRFYMHSMGLEADPTKAENIIRLAEQDLQQAVQEDPSRASAWNTLSRLLYWRYDRPGAHLAAQRAYETDKYLRDAPDILYRLYAISYDMEQFDVARKWCGHGHERYPDNPQFVACRLWLVTDHSQPTPIDEAWRILRELEQSVPKSTWEAVGPQYEMLVAVPIARAGLADSANRVIERARAAPDPDGELAGQEVLVRTLIGDKEEALRKLRIYLTAHPEHRSGFTRANMWWWRSLQDDPRFRAIVGTGS